MAKNIILEHEEVGEVLEALRGTEISDDILMKFQEMFDRENKNYYKAKKGVISREGFFFSDNYYRGPLDFEFKVKKATNIRDYNRNQYQFLWGNYYITRNKDIVFAHKWEVKLYGYGKHIGILEKKIKTLKTEKGKKPYLELLHKIEKKVKYINDHPEKMI